MILFVSIVVLLLLNVLYSIQIIGTWKNAVRNFAHERNVLDPIYEWEFKLECGIKPAKRLYFHKCLNNEICKFFGEKLKVRFNIMIANRIAVQLLCNVIHCVE